MRKYQRLSFYEREEISRCLAMNYSIRQTARYLKRSPSTISREIKKTSRRIGHYRCVLAHSRAKRMNHIPKKPRKLIKNKPLRSFVFKHLQLLWSPEQIAKMITLEYPNDRAMRISHETIYRYLYVRPKGEFKKILIQCLRQEHKIRHKRSSTNRGNSLREYLSIEERPLEVADRIIPGHWEGDLIIGKRQGAALATLVERTTRMTFMVKVKNKEAKTVRRCFTQIFKKLPRELKKSLTYDQGSEMAQHHLFTKKTNIQVYFAHPASPWERGTNENINGLIRQFFPKGTDFNNVSTWKIKRAQELLNTRPRKTLHWQTPQAVFSKAVALAN